MQRGLIEIHQTFSEVEDGSRGWLREEALKEATLLCRCPSCSHVEETNTAASLTANALSALLPHKTRYSPIMISAAPIILHV